MSRYSFDLMSINDENFRGELSRAFTKMNEDAGAGLYSKEDGPAIEQAILEGFRKKYKMPEAEIYRIQDAWNKGGGSFSYLDKNQWDQNVKASEDYGYDWLMNLTDDQLLTYAEANPTLSAKYGLTTPEKEYEHLIREQHAAATTGGSLIEGRPPIRMNESLGRFDANRVAGMNSGFDTKIARWGEASIAYIEDTSESLSSLIEDLQRNGLLADNANDRLLELSKDHARETNKNKTLDALEELRYVDNKGDLADYYSLRSEAQKGIK